jgi:hypothetical protein
MKIDNQLANELLLAVRRGDRINQFMDAVSGVKGYRIGNLNRQGCIRGAFGRELISEQFLLNLEDLVSVFWSGVFEHLDKARLFGDIVVVKQPGCKEETRKTLNNPIHYLRGHGKMAVRNYITGMYRRNLQQGCPECGCRMTVREDKTCPKCGKAMSTVYKYVAAETDVDVEETNQFVPFVPPQQNELDDHNMASKLHSMLNRFAD